VSEIGANALLMAKNIDGVYTDDPRKNPNAVKIDEISYMDVISKQLTVMDTASIVLCKENNIPIVAFGLDVENGLIKAAMGEKIGTIIH
jgi:uridylate kinase